MLYALVDSRKVLACPGAHGTCAHCGGDMVAKCGTIKAWHWAHCQLDCDPWHEGETAWHLGWKARFPAAWVEVSCGAHRADIRTPSYVIELQHSSLAPDDIRAREDFYRNMIWVLDASPFMSRLNFTDRGEYCRFQWLHARPIWRDVAQKPLVFDFGPDGLFAVGRLRKEGNGTFGWGRFISPDALLAGAIDWNQSLMRGRARPPFSWDRVSPGGYLSRVSPGEVFATLFPRGGGDALRQINLL